MILRFLTLQILEQHVFSQYVIQLYSIIINLNPLKNIEIPLVSEDCLTINVFRPANLLENMTLPVVCLSYPQFVVTHSISVILDVSAI